MAYFILTGTCKTRGINEVIFGDFQRSVVEFEKDSIEDGGDPDYTGMMIRRYKDADTAQRYSDELGRVQAAKVALWSLFSDVCTPFTPDDLEKLEKRQVWDRQQAIDYFKSIGEPYKAEIIEDLPEDEPISVYPQGATAVDEIKTNKGR